MSDYTTNSTWLQNVADALAAVAGGLSLANGVEVKAIVWAPRETGKRPRRSSSYRRSNASRPTKLSRRSGPATSG